MAATERNRSGRVTRRRRRRLGKLPWLAAGLGTAAARGADAQSYVDTRVLFYQESGGRTQVIDPVLLLHQDLGAGGGELDLIAGYDAISGASPTGGYPTFDVTTSASGHTSASGQFPLASYNDQRASLSAAYRRRFGAHLPQVDLSYSKENDYTARAIGIGDAWTLLEGRGTLHVGASMGNDVVSPVGTQLQLAKKSSGYALGWTWVADERNVLDVSASLQRLSGYLDDPYKVVPVGTPEAATNVPEHRPDSRSRFALVGRWGHYYRWDGAIKSSYRFYSDDWGIRAHTIEIDYDQHLGSDWIVSPQVRLYVQSRASFYGSLFAAPQQYMSADYRLSPFKSVLGGLQVSRKIFAGLEVYAGVTYQMQQGSDRIVLSAPVTGGEDRFDDDDEHERENTTTTVSTAAADFNTATIVIGFRRHF